MRQQCQGLDQSIRWLIGLDSRASLIHPETIHSPIVEMHVHASLDIFVVVLFQLGRGFLKLVILSCSVLLCV